MLTKPSQKEYYYRGLVSKDKRFDGLFYVGVSSTNIYCRPVCTAKTPKFENCTFFKSAAQAEVSGFRPCLKCRPELAPGQAPVDASQRLAKQALLVIQEQKDMGIESTEKIAERLGISERHLRRILQTVYGVSPREIAKTQKLLTAKRLLTDTSLSLTEIAFASGFKSVRSFNHQFKTHYAMAPSKLRLNSSTQKTDLITLKLSYRPPLAWEQMLAFLKNRAISGVEEIQEDEYRRTIEVSELTGWIRVHKDHEHLVLTIPYELLPATNSIVLRVNRLFDLEANPNLIANQLSNGPILKSALEKHAGLRVPGAFSEFEICVRAIVGQLVSVKSASTIMTRFVYHYGKDIKTPHKSLNKIMPTPALVSSLKVEDLVKIGLTRIKANAIIALANSMKNRELDFNSSLTPEELSKKLLAIRGIGPWTASYIGMRVMRNPDAFPSSDLVLRKVLGIKNIKEIEELSKDWQPWRAYAAMYLWSMNSNA